MLAGGYKERVLTPLGRGREMRWDGNLEGNPVSLVPSPSRRSLTRLLMTSGAWHDFLC